MRYRLKHIFLVAALILVGNSADSALAQLAAPNVQDVYGGRILGISGYALTADSTRIFISTESANTLFYVDVFSNTTSPSGSDFQTVPSVDADDDYGDRVSLIAAHEGSGYIFFAHPDDGLLKASISSTTPDVVTTGFVSAMTFRSDTLAYINANGLYLGEVDASGNFTALVSGVATGLSGSQQTIAVHPISNGVYAFSSGTSPELRSSDDAISAITTATTFSSISLSSLSTSVEWKAFGIAPSGRLFVFGDDGLDKYVAYSDDETTWTQSSIGGGVSGPNVDFHGDATTYSVYHAKLYNHANGTGAWSQFGNVSLETHPNDGAVFADVHNDQIVAMTTDQGIGATVNGGSEIFEIDEGVEAVQVRDFDMTASKATGWLASKSGVRQVTDFLTSPTWSNALFPNGDGSPYYSIEMDPADSLYVYAGNVRVYRTVDDGGSWTRLFTPEDPPYNFPGVGTKALAIEVSPYDSSLVFAGFEIADTDQGGLFWSEDRGATWDQILLRASTAGQDVDVSDIVFTVEGTDTLAYVSALYDLGATSTTGRSVYKLTKSGSSWTVSQDMNSTGTSTGSLIVATIWDLEQSVTADTVFAVGTDAGINHPVTYFKDLSTAVPLWTPLTPTGFPFAIGKEATAASVGGDTLFVGVDNEVYWYKMGATAWSLGYTYPVGTRINMLYYDDLLVGVGTGIYAHFVPGGSTETATESTELPIRATLNQNYPNPFNPSTEISFSLRETTHVSLQVFDMLGRRIGVLADGIRSSGVHHVTFDASALTSGLYLYRLESTGVTVTRTMLLIK